MEWTPFAGLTAPDENDPITVDGGSFLTKNPRITDRLLKVGAITHRHDEHPALSNPHVSLTGVALPTGGTIAASAAYSLTYTVVDHDGGETLGAAPLVLTTAPALDGPAIAPQATFASGSGIMPAGDYYYALTYTDGEGGETTIGPAALVTVPPGFASASVILSELATELAPAGNAVNWRLWRSYEGADWHLVTQGSADTYIDAGFDPPDNPAQPPEGSSTGSTYSFQVTLPTALAEPVFADPRAASINVYLAPDNSFQDPSFYANLPLASAGATFTIAQETVSQGSPPHSSTSLRGANKIDPESDIRNNHWRIPVDSYEFLGSGSQGDVRMTKDTGVLYEVRNRFGAAVPADWVPVDRGIGIALSPIADVYSTEWDTSGGGSSASVHIYQRDVDDSRIVAISPSGSAALPVSDPIGIAIALDGANVYIAQETGIKAYQRDPHGALTLIQTVSTTGVTNPLGPAGVTLRAIAITPDGKWVYVTTAEMAIGCFQRHIDGTLTLAINQSVDDPRNSIVGGGYSVDGDWKIAIAPEGDFLYCLGTPGIAQFSIDDTSGLLTHVCSAGLTTETGILHWYGAYVFNPGDRFNYDPSGLGSGCIGPGVAGGLTPSPDGRYLYGVGGALASGGDPHASAAAGSPSVWVFDRHGDGTLTFFACAATGDMGEFGGGTYDVGVSPDNRNVYVTGHYSVTSFKRNDDGTLTLIQSIAMPHARTQITVTADGKSVYTVGLGQRGVDEFQRNEDGTLTLLGEVGNAPPPGGVLTSSPAIASFVSYQVLAPIDMLSFVASGADIKVVDLGGGSAQIQIDFTGSGARGPAGPDGPEGPEGPRGPAGAGITELLASAGNASAAVGWLGFAGSGGITTQLTASGGSAVVIISASGAIGPAGPPGASGAGGGTAKIAVSDPDADEVNPISAIRFDLLPRGTDTVGGELAVVVTDEGGGSALVQYGASALVNWRGDWQAGLGVWFIGDGCNHAGRTWICVGDNAGSIAAQPALSRPDIWQAIGGDPSFAVSDGVGGSALAGGESAIPIEFIGAGAATAVTSTGGSAVVTITVNDPDVPAAGNASAYAIAASGGASAIKPSLYTEFAGSGSVGVAVQDLGGGSARVLVGASPGTADRAYCASAAFLPGGDNQVIPLDTISFQSGAGAWDLANHQFVAAASGYYRAAGQVNIGTEGTAGVDNMQPVLLKNGVPVSFGEEAVPSAFNSLALTIDDLVTLAPGDTLQLALNYADPAVLQEPFRVVSGHAVYYGGVSNYLSINSANGIPGPPGPQGAAGPGGAPGGGIGASAVAIAGSAGVNEITPSLYTEFAASGAGIHLAVQNLGGGSARVLIGATTGSASVFRAHAAGSDSFPDNTSTKLSIDTVDLAANFGFLDAANHRFVCTQAGYYDVEGYAILQDTSAFKFGIASLFQNGSLVAWGTESVAQDPSVTLLEYFAASFVGTKLYLASGDTVDLRANATTGDGAATNPGAANVYLAISPVGVVGQQGPAGTTAMFAVEDGVTRVAPVGDIRVTGATVTDLGGGSAQITVNPDVDLGIQASAGSGSILPITDIEFAGSGRVRTQLINRTGGSAIVLIGFDQTPVYTVRARGDGGDDYPALQLAINKAQLVAGIVDAPDPLYRVSKGLSATSVIEFAGGGMDRTVVQAASAMAAVFTATWSSGGKHYVTRDVKFDGNSLATNGYVQTVATETSVAMRAYRVCADGATGYQFVNNGCEDATWADCLVDGNEGSPTSTSKAMQLVIPTGAMTILGGQFFGDCDINAQTVEVAGTVLGPIVIENAAALTSTTLSLDGCYVYDGGSNSRRCIDSTNHLTNISAKGTYFVAQVQRDWIHGDIPAGVSINLDACTFIWGPATAGNNYAVSATGAGNVNIRGWGASVGAGTFNLLNVTSGTVSLSSLDSAGKFTTPTVKPNTVSFPGGDQTSPPVLVASAGSAAASLGNPHFLGFAGSGGTAVQLIGLGGGSAVILISASGGAQGPAGGAGPAGPAGPTIAVEDSLTRVTPVSDIKFMSGASVVDAGGGSAQVTITGGGGGGGAVAVAGSAGITPVNPVTDIEFAGSANIDVAVQNLTGGSARVVIGQPISPRIVADDDCCYAALPAGAIVSGLTFDSNRLSRTLASAGSYAIGSGALQGPVVAEVDVEFMNGYANGEFAIYLTRADTGASWKLAFQNDGNIVGTDFAGTVRFATGGSKQVVGERYRIRLSLSELVDAGTNTRDATQQTVVLEIKEGFVEATADTGLTNTNGTNIQPWVVGAKMQSGQNVPIGTQIALQITTATNRVVQLYRVRLNRGPLR